MFTASISLSSNPPSHFSVIAGDIRSIGMKMKTYISECLNTCKPLLLPDFLDANILTLNHSKSKPTLDLSPLLKLPPRRLICSQPGLKYMGVLCMCTIGSKHIPYLVIYMYMYVHYLGLNTCLIWLFTCMCTIWVQTHALFALKSPNNSSQ